jgi:hypothetical protein
MSILLPVDDNGHPINVLGFDYRGTQKLAVGGAASTRNPTPIASDIQLVTLIATGPLPVRAGRLAGDGRPDRSPFLSPGQYVDVPLRPGERYVALIAEGADCDVYLIGRI